MTLSRQIRSQPQPPHSGQEVAIVRDSIGVSISACHAEDPGSIPGRGVFTNPERAFRESCDDRRWALRTVLPLTFKLSRMVYGYRACFAVDSPGAESQRVQFCGSIDCCLFGSIEAIVGSLHAVITLFSG